MIAAIIVGGSLVLAAAYALLWWSRPALRRRIEAPGAGFVANATRYDSACRNQGSSAERRTDDSDQDNG
jgi:hypothetical protein